MKEFLAGLLKEKGVPGTACDSQLFDGVDVLTV